MPAESRGTSRDREVTLRHQHSFSSDSGRLSIPMWDSSDPERAPPPLPLNPIGPNVSPTKPNTSATVAAAAQALAERARESAGLSSYTVNDFPGRSRSPEKSPTKTPQHRRLQSLQTRSTKELKASFENSASSIRESRPTTPSGSVRDIFSSSPERITSRAVTPTPAPSNIFKESTPARSASPNSSRSMINENTPPAARMLTMKSPETTPLADISNMSASRGLPSSGTLHEQMQNLTAIATTLQKEMSALSRRSRDNATDLLSLKEAQSNRDKDIRDSLKELITTSTTKPDTNRTVSALGLHNHLIDNKPYTSPPFTKSVSLPRIPSVHFDAASDHSRPGSPSLYSVEGAASVAMLEKIIREMVTKEGQERLLTNLSELLNKSSVASTDTAKKVEELVEFIKDKSNGQALIKATPVIGNSPPHLDLNYSSPRNSVIARSGFRHSSADELVKGSSNQNILSDDLLRLLQRIKDSVTQTGGLTGEVKSLVRELRGEVLGMGRELGRKLDAVEATPMSDDTAEDSVSREELSRIVQEGLVELKEQMNHVIEARRRQSSGSAISRSPVDNNEVYAVVKHALAERGLDKDQNQTGAIDQQAILDTIKEAYENYKPEIEVQQFGLEREEILQCLKEGLEDYQANKSTSNSNSVNRDDVLSAVQEALQYFNPPAPVTEASEIKEEVLMTVRECLESFKASISEDVERNKSTVTREDVTDAVRAELDIFKQEGPREVEISSEDLYNAVKAGLETMDKPLGEYGDQVLTSVHAIIDGMRNEFKDNFAANGRDTEQVLDALKDGLEGLRAEIESYVDRAQDVTGKDEIIDTLKTGLESIKLNFENQVTRSGGDSDDTVLERADVTNFIKAEFEQLHESLAAQKDASGLDPEVREDIVNAITEGLIAIKHDIGEQAVNGLNSETLEAVKEEVENLRIAILAGSSMHKDEILDVIHDSMGALHNKLDTQSTTSQPNNYSNEEIIALVREEFEILKDTIGVSSSRSIDIDAKEDMLNVVKEAMDVLKVQITSDQSQAAQESLSLIREELELLRNSLGGNMLTQGSAVSDKHEIIEAMREGLAELHESQSSRGMSDVGNEPTLDMLRGEIERLRQSVASAVTRTGPQHESVEIIDIIRLGLDDLRSDIERKLDNPERFASSKTEILEALNDGIDGLRTDISSLNNKPVDMTVTYEILDTLRDGIADLRADLSKLTSKDSETTPKLETSSGNEVVLADPGNVSMTRDVTTDDETQSAQTLKKDDLEKMEVILAQLQIKVEAMDQNPHDTQTAEFQLNDKAKDSLQTIEEVLRELQLTVSELLNREVEVKQAEGTASKEDTDAIETLLQNVKAKIEETFETAVTKDQIDVVEASVKLTSESVDNLTTRLEENMPTKVEFAALELLLQNATTSLNEMKEVAINDKDKAEFEFVEGLCVEIKDKLAELPLADSVPSKAEIDDLTEIVKDFKASYEVFKERYENDIGITAKAFDDRKDESREMKDMIVDLKDFIGESTEALKTKIKRGNADVRAIDEILESIEGKIEEVPKTSSEIHELLFAFKDEFEKAHGHLETMKAAQEDNSAMALEKQESMKDEMITELAVKIEERFAEFMTRQDDHYLLSEQMQKELADKVTLQEEVFSGHKTMAEELKLTIDTLGASITGITPALTEATEKVSDDSRIVFGKIDDVRSKLDSHFYDFKTEHEHTRGEVAKSLAAVANVHQEVTCFNPKALDMLSNLLKTTGEHFEHSRKFQETSVLDAQRSREEFDTIKHSFAALPVPRIEAPPITPEKFDDSKLHSKLDELLSRDVTKPDETDAGLEKLDQMHKQIVEAASQLSGLIAAQRKAISDEHDSKAAEAEEAAKSVAKCLAEKERLESSIAGLQETKESLMSDVSSLKSEQSALTSQKTRLSAEVSSLETALNIRREELHMMDARAEALERRIMEKVMDHSRALLIAKTPKSAINMNLKRVSSSASQTTASTTVPNSVISAGMNMALKARPITRRSTKTMDPAGRRILSLSQINKNLPGGGQTVSPTPRNINNGLSNLKRSQSVKNSATRKASWAGQGSLVGYDKENSVLEESDHEDHEEDRSRPSESRVSRSISNTGTDMSSANRRSSYGTGTVASEYSYDTGSYITGTDIDRRSSYGSTIRSTNIGASALDGSIYEEDEEDDHEDDEHEKEHDTESRQMRDEEEEEEEEEEERLVQQAVPLVARALKKYVEQNSLPEGYDSGLGSDLPTVALSPTVASSDYFEHK